MPAPFSTRTLTAANAVIALSIPALFSTPQILQGFSADNVFETNSPDVAETASGVDGFLSAGYVYNPVDQTITLQADSLSNDVFDAWLATSKQQQTVFRCQGRTQLPALGKSYIMVNGVLVNMAPIPAVNKLIQQRKFLIRWQDIQPVPV